MRSCISERRGGINWKHPASFKLQTVKYLILFLLLTANIALAQTNILKEGVYPTFHSFKNNSPIETSVVLVSNDNYPMYGSGRSVTEQDHSALEVIDYNQVSFVETNIKKKKFKNKIWGFFDDKDIYIYIYIYKLPQLFYGLP